MGGHPKLLLEYNDKTFFEHIYGCIRMVFPDNAIYLSVNEAGRFRELGLPLIVDEYNEIGPMGGILSALHQTAGAALLVVACDMPCLTAEFLQKMKDVYDKKPGLILAKKDGQEQPLLAIYPRNVVSYMECAAETGAYKLQSVLAEYAKCHFVNYVDGESDSSSCNINTKADYENLVRGITE